MTTKEFWIPTVCFPRSARESLGDSPNPAMLWSVPARDSYSTQGSCYAVRNDVTLTRRFRFLDGQMVNPVLVRRCGDSHWICRFSCFFVDFLVTDGSDEGAGEATKRRNATLYCCRHQPFVRSGNRLFLAFRRDWAGFSGEGRVCDGRVAVSVVRGNCDDRCHRLGPSFLLLVQIFW